MQLNGQCGGPGVAGSYRARIGSGSSRQTQAAPYRLKQLMGIADQSLLVYRNVLTGLFETNPQSFADHAWIRDNVYAAMSIWALHLAYAKSADSDEDSAKAHELGQCCVKTMQSLLECMMQHTDKIERFKHTLLPIDAIHAKYSVQDKSPVVSDHHWGHLQMDSISLYLLTLAQMTGSGLQIVRNQDEVAFVQNLVYYIERAYSIPDFGIWERGDKTNQGAVELNCSSIGMAKAAMQALNDVGDLYGDGSSNSSIVILPDEIQQCTAVLTSMLPRESFSKETDSALLSIISYPAFAVEDEDLTATTLHTIQSTLVGNYGCRRFIRDGFKTVLEDPNRVYYHNSELQQFENIECEWPLFFCYLLIEAIFEQKPEEIVRYHNLLLEHLVIDEEGNELVTELFLVPAEKVQAEKKERCSQDRVSGGRTPYIWAQSLYIIAELILDGTMLLPAELDPLTRRLNIGGARPATEVQVVVLADNAKVKSELKNHKIDSQIVDEIDPLFVIRPASVLARILNTIGANSKLELSGRPLDRDVGLLSTSKLFHVADKMVLFEPQFMESTRSYIYEDTRVLMDEWRDEVKYLYSCWNNSAISGRPLVALVITEQMMKSTWSRAHGTQSSVVISTIQKMQDGYLGGAQISVKRIKSFFSTTAVSKLQIKDDRLIDELLNSRRRGPRDRLTRQLTRKLDKARDAIDSNERYNYIHKQSMRQRNIMSNEAGDIGGLGKKSVEGAIMTLRIPTEDDLQRLRMRYYQEHATSINELQSHDSSGGNTTPMTNSMYSSNSLYRTNNSTDAPTTPTPSNHLLDAAPMLIKRAPNTIDTIQENSNFDRTPTGSPRPESPAAMKHVSSKLVFWVRLQIGLCFGFTYLKRNAEKILKDETMETMKWLVGYGC